MTNSFAMTSYSDEEDDCGGYEGDDYVEIDEEEKVDDHAGMENFAVLTVEELEKRQNEDISNISSVLSVSREAAILVLIHFNWNASAAEEEWFRDDGDRIRQSIGLLKDPVVSNLSSFIFNVNDIVMCRICFKDFGADHMTSAACGHVFCSTCWNSYISFSINDGPGCLTLRCPDPSCSVSIGENIMMKLVSKEDAYKYSKYLIRSYVENSKRLKWCPSPNCDYAIEYELGSGSFDVKCGCSYSFCWNCLEEIHRPVDCDTVANWNSKNKRKRVLANSKPCPKCKKPIENDLDNKHMTLTCTSPCNHQFCMGAWSFCWLCMVTWSRTTGLEWASCNKNEKTMQESKLTEEERIKIAAENYPDKYIHFYERWSANEDSRKKSLMHLEQLKSNELQKLSDVQQVFIMDVEYIIKAWEQIIECRRLLKWAYAYGYYIPDEERAKKEFFEFIKGEAEGALERLHQCAEKEVLQYADAKGPSPDFKNLEGKLRALTDVTRDYFEHLVRALENGLADVTSKDECKTEQVLVLDD